ncbi:MAG: aspartate aminotransferase family protein [Clostridia bacterium]|nr:aspartate aminotransferase family protein [Clostridia bacterium]
MNLSSIKSQADNSLMPTYAHFPVSIEKGNGATFIDSEGNEVIDFGSGIGVNSLGYNNDGWIDAVTEQLKKVQHTSNLYYNSTVAEYTEMLTKRTGFNRVFLCNSGAEANECAIKLARKYSFDKYGENRYNIITLVNSFHGRTMATITATGQEHYHKFFNPFVQGFKYAESGNTEQFLEMADDTVCAIILEIVQGEGGVVPTDFEYLKTVEKVCKEKDILLIIDEVQTGMGRTGKLFAYEHAGISPDVVTSAKGIGNGLPMGACLCTEKCADVLTAGTHGTTFGGNPVACAGAKYILNTLTDDFLKEVNEKGEYIRTKLAEIEEIASISGLGLMLGIELKTKNAGEIAKKCSENGLLILTAKTKLRMLPPLVITKEEIDKGMEILKSFLED